MKQPEIVDVREESAGVVAVREELDMQVTTGKRYPRNLAAFKKELLALATSSAETAEEMFYSLPRDKKNDDGTKSKVNIEGRSTRFAELVAYCYTNLRIEQRAEIGDTHATGYGTAFDVERNVGIRCEVKTKIITKDGFPFSKDMQTMAANAAASKASRNAILKIVPESLTEEAYQAARKVAAGDNSNINTKRQQALVLFQKRGVSAEQVLAFLERANVQEINGDDLIRLRGILTAVKDGEATIESFFPEAKTEAPIKKPTAKAAQAQVAASMTIDEARKIALPDGAELGQMSLEELESISTEGLGATEKIAIVILKRELQKIEKQEAPTPVAQQVFPEMPPAVTPAVIGDYVIEGGAYAGKSLAALGHQVAAAILKVKSRQEGMTERDLDQIIEFASKR